jgi:hypothetical protein
MNNMENNHLDQPDQIDPGVPENDEIAVGKDIQALLVANPDVPPMKLKDGPKRESLFHSLKLFITNKFTHQKSSPTEVIGQQTLEIDKKLPDEIEGQNIFVEKRMENLLEEIPRIVNEPQPSEISEEEVQSNIILTNLSEDTDPDLPQAENVSNLPLEEPSLPEKFTNLPSEEPSQSENPFEPARLLTSYFAKDIDDIESYIEEEDLNSADAISEEPSFIQSNEETTLSEDQDLNERFLALLAQEETPEVFQPAFFPEDLENLKEFSQKGDEEPIVKHSKDLSVDNLPEIWNKTFTSDPTGFIEATTFDNSEVKEEKKEDESENSPTALQLRLAQTKDQKKEREEYSLILQNGLYQSEKPDQKEEYSSILQNELSQRGKTEEKKEGNPEVDLDVSSPSTKTIENDEEIIPNPWEAEPEWSSLVIAEEGPVETGPSDEIIEAANQGDPDKVIPEKGVIASISLLIKIFIIFLFIVDIVIIGMVANSYQKIPFMAKATATVIPSEATTNVKYVYPNALKLTGGWIIQLNQGHLANDNWAPLSAEWLIDTAFRRVVAVPWSKQLEAVTLTLNPGDPIDLYMINSDVVSYQVEQVTKVPQSDTSFLKRNTPALIIILYRPDAQDRWVIICGQK